VQVDDAWARLSLEERLGYGLPRLGLAVACEAAVRLGADRQAVARRAMTRLGIEETLHALTSAVAMNYVGYVEHSAAAILWFAAADEGKRG
jgi:hypothetical protein